MHEHVLESAIGPLWHRIWEWRRSRAPYAQPDSALLCARSDDWPLPPARLVMTVGSEPSLDWYVESGARDAHRLRDVFDRAGVQRSGREKLLDFGCGCGRLTRHLSSWTTERVLATDRSKANIHWCRDNLPIADFATNDLRPPLGLADASVDIAVAWSVFTHLDETLCEAWLGELQRVLAPHGHLVLTTHGRPYRPHLSSAADRDRFDAGEIVIRRRRGVGTNLCAAFHPAERMRSILARRFSVLAHDEGDERDERLQDVWLVRRDPLL